METKREHTRYPVDLRVDYAMGARPGCLELRHGEELMPLVRGMGIKLIGMGTKERRRLADYLGTLRPTEPLPVPS